MLMMDVIEKRSFFLLNPMSALDLYLQRHRRTASKDPIAIQIRDEEFLKRDASIAKLEGQVESLKERNESLCGLIRRLEDDHAKRLTIVRDKLAKAEAEASSLVEEIENKFGESRFSDVLVQKLLLAKHNKEGFYTLLESIAVQAREKRELSLPTVDEEKRLRGLESLCRALNTTYRERDLLREQCRNAFELIERNEK